MAMLEPRRLQEEQDATSERIEQEKEEEGPSKKEPPLVNQTADVDVPLLPKSALRNETKGNQTAPLQTPPDPLQNAAMLFNDGDLDRLHSLAAPKTLGASSQQHWYYETYPTTLSLIFLLHIIFFYQWNARKTRKQVLVTYQHLVKQKQYYRGVLAFLSHPPVDRESSGGGGSASNIMDHHSLETSSSGLVRRLRGTILRPLFRGHLTGLYALAYNTHILWTCRALEPLCPSSGYYARMLLGLTAVALFVDLSLAAKILQAASSTMMHSERLVARRRQTLHQTKGTTTALTSALLLLYRTALPHVALPVLPLLPFSFGIPPFLSYWMCLLWLFVASWHSHRFMSVVSGTASALLWRYGVTSFLAHPYWGLCLTLWIVLACLVSLRGEESLAGWVPCIDYVAWDARGRMRSSSTQQRPTRDAAIDRSTLLVEDNEEEEEDEEQDETEEADGQQELIDLERQPLRPSSSGGSGLRGRVPMVDMDDDDFVPRSSTSRHAPPTRQRRGLGGGGSSSFDLDSSNAR